MVVHANNKTSQHDMTFSRLADSSIIPNLTGYSGPGMPIKRGFTTCNIFGTGVGVHGQDVNLRLVINGNMVLDAYNSDYSYRVNSDSDTTVFFIFPVITPVGNATCQVFARGNASNIITVENIGDVNWSG